MRRSAVPLALLLVIAAAGAAFAIFTQSKTVDGNTFSTSADWEAPIVSSAVIAKTVGYVSGYIKQGGTFYVYANVTDGGNPASGVSTVKADVSQVAVAQTDVPLSAGSFSVGGVAYNYRSASVTATAVLAAGTYPYTVTATDAGGHVRVESGLSVVVDNTPPAASDVQTANGGAIAGRADVGDSITYTFSEAIDPNSILAGWTGASTRVVVRLNQVSGSDTVTIYNAANSAQLPFGTVSLGRTDYTSSNRTFGASGTASTMVMSGNAIIVTLGTQSGAATTAGGTGTMSWTPSATVTDRAGNACSTTARSETGSADKEF